MIQKQETDTWSEKVRMVQVRVKVISINDDCVGLQWWGFEALARKYSFFFQVYLINLIGELKVKEEDSQEIKKFKQGRFTKNKCIHLFVLIWIIILIILTQAPAADSKEIEYHQLIQCKNIQTQITSNIQIQKHKNKANNTTTFYLFTNCHQIRQRHIIQLMQFKKISTITKRTSTSNEPNISAVYQLMKDSMNKLQNCQNTQEALKEQQYLTICIDMFQKINNQVQQAKRRYEGIDRQTLVNNKLKYLAGQIILFRESAEITHSQIQIVDRQLDKIRDQNLGLQFENQCLIIAIKKKQLQDNRKSMYLTPHNNSKPNDTTFTLSRTGKAMTSADLARANSNKIQINERYSQDLLLQKNDRIWARTKQRGRINYKATESQVIGVDLVEE